MHLLDNPLGLYTDPSSNRQLAHIISPVHTGSSLLQPCCLHTLCVGPRSMNPWSHTYKHILPRVSRLAFLQICDGRTLPLIGLRSALQALFSAGKRKDLILFPPPFASHDKLTDTSVGVVEIFAKARSAWAQVSTGRIATLSVCAWTVLALVNICASETQNNRQQFIALKCGR